MLAQSLRRVLDGVAGDDADRLTFALAEGTRVFEASFTGVASIASTEAAGFVHIRAEAMPSPIHSTPSRIGLLAQPLIVVLDLGIGRADEALDGHVALVVVERGEQLRQRGQRIGDDAAELPR